MSLPTSLSLAIIGALFSTALWFAWGKRFAPTLYGHLETSVSLGLLVGSLVFVWTMPPQVPSPHRPAETAVPAQFRRD